MKHNSQQQALASNLNKMLVNSSLHYYIYTSYATALMINKMPNANGLNFRVILEHWGFRAWMKEET